MKKDYEPTTRLGKTLASGAALVATPKAVAVATFEAIDGARLVASATERIDKAYRRGGSLGDSQAMQVLVRFVGGRLLGLIPGRVLRHFLS